VLGSSVPGTAIPASYQGVCTLELSISYHGPAGDRTVALAMPFNNTPPRQGKRVGGVSERAGVRAGGSNPFASIIPSRVVTVEGILVFWKAALFAGRCRNEGLGRSVLRWRSPPLPVKRAGDSGCPKAAKEGIVVGTRHKNACAPNTTRDHSCALGTRPSLGPSTRARRSSLCTIGAIRGGGAVEAASRLGKPAQVGGTNTGAITNGRSAARRISALRQRELRRVPGM